MDKIFYDNKTYDANITNLTIHDIQHISVVQSINIEIYMDIFNLSTTLNNPSEIKLNTINNIFDQETHIKNFSILKDDVFFLYSRSINTTPQLDL